MLDILVQFNSGYWEKGSLINNRKQIVLHYMSNWFLVDLVASFPYSWIVEVDSMEQDEDHGAALAKTPQLLKLIKMTRFLRFLRLLRVFKLK